MIPGVLVDQVSNGNDCAGPWVNGPGQYVAVRGNIEWVGSLRHVEGAFEDTVVVVVPIQFIGDAIVVVVKRACSIATVESLNQIVDAVVVVVKVVEIVDTIVVVVTTTTTMVSTISTTLTTTTTASTI